MKFVEIILKGVINLVDRIKKLAEQQGVSIRQLELALGMGNGTIGKWDKQHPSVEKLMMVAEYLNSDLMYILTGAQSHSQAIKNTPANETLTEDESELLSYYRKLGPEGKIIVKAKAIEELRLAECARARCERAAQTG